MSLSARRALGVGLLLITGLSYAGCAATGTGSDALRPGSPEAGSNDGSEAGSNEEGGAPDTVGGGGKSGMGTLNTDPTAGAGAPDESCAADVSKAEVVPLDLYIMLDVSGSMLSDTSTFDSTGTAITKWSALKGALESFITDDASMGLGVGLQYFPLNKPNLPDSCSTNSDCGTAAPCAFSVCWNTNDVCQTQADCPGSASYNPCWPIGTCAKAPNLECPVIGLNCVDDFGKDLGACVAITSSVCGHPAKCDSASYAVPAEPIATLPDAAPALIASIESQSNLEGNYVTPTGPALSGAIAQASAWAKAHPDHQVVTVLATDGLPKDCTPTSAADLKKLAAAGLAASPSVSTFTIGIFTIAGAAQGKALLDSIAQGGGTQSAFVISTTDDVTAQFQQALQAIRSSKLACDYKIPAPRDHQNVDYSLVNVDFKKGNQSSALYYVGSVDDCDPLDGGWYYDSDPRVADPTRIEICPTTCAAFKAATDASVQIAVGCKTVVK